MTGVGQLSWIKVLGPKYLIQSIGTKVLGPKLPIQNEGSKPASYHRWMWLNLIVGPSIDSDLYRNQLSKGREVRDRLRASKTVWREAEHG